MLRRDSRTERYLRRSLQIFIGCMTLGVLSTPAGARPEYPAEVQEGIGLDCTPSCLLCHTILEGGLEYLNPYGGSLIAAIGRKGAAQAVLDSAQSHSDDDGIPDLEEIYANTDPSTPNKPGEGDPICSAAQYGCGARIAPLSGSALADKGWSLLAALGVAMLLFRQRRRSA